MDENKLKKIYYAHASTHRNGSIVENLLSFKSFKEVINKYFEEKELPITEEEVKNLPLGVAKIYWMGGGHSFASIGMLYSGKRWFAPCNWTTSNDAEPYGVVSSDWEKVKKVEMIDVSNYEDKNA